MIRLFALWLGSRLFGWQLGTGGGASIGTATPAAVTPEQAGAAGAGPAASPEQHVHPTTAVAPTIGLAVAAVEGAAATFVRSDATLAAFDATVPVTQAYADAAAVGAAAVASRRDHVHGMPAAARLRSIQILTAGVGATYTRPAGVVAILVELLGGGGGGGGADGNVTNGAAGGGGSAGRYAFKYYAAAAATYLYTIGAGGAAGAAAGGNGGSGGSTTFDNAGAIVTAPGGPGGTGDTGGTGVAFVRGGASPAAATGGDYNGGAVPGLPGSRNGQASIMSGPGGSSRLGGGGPAVVAGAGLAALGNSGSGGSGGSTNADADLAGGAGGSGVIVVYEYG